MTGTDSALCPCHPEFIKEISFVDNSSLSLNTFSTVDCLIDCFFFSTIKKVFI